MDTQKYKFNLEIGGVHRTAVFEFDPEAYADEDIDEALNAWVDAQVDRWFEVVE